MEIHPDFTSLTLALPSHEERERSGTVSLLDQWLEGSPTKNDLLGVMRDNDFGPGLVTSFVEPDMDASSMTLNGLDQRNNYSLAQQMSEYRRDSDDGSEALDKEEYVETVALHLIHQLSSHVEQSENEKRTPPSRRIRKPVKRFMEVTESSSSEISSTEISSSESSSEISSTENDNTDSDTVSSRPFTPIPHTPSSTLHLTPSDTQFTCLGEMIPLNDYLLNHSRDDPAVLLLHRLLFDCPGKKRTRKKRIRCYTGKLYNEVVLGDRLKFKSLRDLKLLCGMLGCDKRGDRVMLQLRLLEFLREACVLMAKNRITLKEMSLARKKKKEAIDTLPRDLSDLTDTSDLPNLPNLPNTMNITVSAPDPNEDDHIPLIYRLLPTRAQLKSAIQRILQEANLTQLTMAQVCTRIQEEFQVTLRQELKIYVKETVLQIIKEMNDVLQDQYVQQELQQQPEE